MEGKGRCNVKLSTGGGIRWGATEGKGSYNVKSSDDTDIVSCFLLTQHKDGVNSKELAWQPRKPQFLCLFHLGYYR